MMGTTDTPQPRQYPSLADDERFPRWTTPRPWPGGIASFGSVIDDLIDGVVDFASQPQTDSYRRWSMPAAVGCVPWMNHERLIAALASLGGCCIVMDKGSNDHKAVKALRTNGRAMSTAYLPGFNEVGLVRPVGGRPMITPGGMTGPAIEDLGPVRKAGWRRDRSAPLIHAKLLVLGDAWGYDNDEEGDWGPQYRFRPRRAWHGSTNWTRNAEKHLESGLWIDQSELVDHTFQFLLDLLKFSEPYEATNAHPQPELIDAEWDDDAFLEYLAEYGGHGDDDTDS